VAVSDGEIMGEEDWMALIRSFSPSFRSAYFGQWIEDTDIHKEEECLYDLAREYHQRCDDYDRAVCSGKSVTTGEPFPADNYQMEAINRHAIQVRDEIIGRGKSLGLSEERVWGAIQKYHT
jgi:hypothetical protein